MTSKSESWRFPLNDYGQRIGVSDSGIETFRGTPVKSLAREICQNSVDARRSKDKPVTVVFQTFSLHDKQIPGFSELKKDIERAKQFWVDDQGNKTAEKFFNKAFKMMDSEMVPCLRISDYNTTGLTGSEELYNSSWNNLIKSQGSSDKGGVSGGSFGIGKFATFTLSALRTVFYSTYDIDKVSAFQGVARLTTFRNASGKETQGIGFYGLPKNRPVPHQLMLEPGTKPRSGDDFGTDIYIIGFQESHDWEEDIIKSVLDGFLYAVMHDILVVKVNSITVDKNSLPDLMNQFKNSFAEYADNYYQVMTDAEKGETPVFEKDIEGLGNARLALTIDPGLHRKVAMIRGTGMKIMDQGRISSSIPFAGVLYVEGEKLNQFLREMENPQHTKWEAARAEGHKNKAERVKKALLDFIRNSLNELKKTEDADTINPDTGSMLSFHDDPDEKEQEDQEGISDAVRTVDLKVREFKTAQTDNPDSESSLLSEDEEGEDENSTESSGTGAQKKGDSSSHEQKGEKNGSGTGPNPEPRPAVPRKPIPFRMRSICLDRMQGKYRLIIIPQADAADASIDLYLSAETNRYKANLVKAEENDAKPLTVNDNVIEHLDLQKGSPLSVTIWLKNKDYCSLEGAIYGNQK